MPGLMSHGNYEIIKWSEVAQSCPTLCNPMDSSLPGSSVHVVFQARILSGLPLPSPDLPWPGSKLLHWQVDSFPEPPGKPQDNSGQILTDPCVLVCASEQMPAEGCSAKVSWRVSEFLNANLYKDQRGSLHFYWMLLCLDVMSGTMAAIYDHEIS